MPFLIRFALTFVVFKLAQHQIAATEICGGRLTGPMNTITTPNYPQTYNYDANCEWLVEAAEGEVIELTFIDFDVEDFDGACETDVVHVRNGMDESVPLLGKVLCGQKIPEVITSSSNYLFISFRSAYESFGGRGFHATYVTKPAGKEESCISNLCGGVIENVRSCTIQSPGYPTGYEGNLNCSWLIKAPTPGSKISFEFDSLKLDTATSQCTKNNVTLHDGDSVHSPIIYESVCDLKFNRLSGKKLISSGSVMFVSFRTSNPQSGSVRGFNAKFDITDEATTPSNLMTSTSALTTTTTVKEASSTKAQKGKWPITTIAKKAKHTSQMTRTTKLAISRPTFVKKLITTTKATTTTIVQSENSMSNPTALSGAMIGVIVAIVVVLLLVAAFWQWKKVNSKLAAKLPDEDNRSDVATLISSSDSNESIDWYKNNGRIVRVPETDSLSQL